MEIPCCTPPVLCDDPSRPIGNFSSQTPDAEVFIARFYDPSPDPRLGKNFRTLGCIGVCESTVSQQAANECAQRQQVNCVATENPDEEPNPNPDLPPITNPQATFLNEAQSCSVTCADGDQFTYTVPAGTFRALSQASANAIAKSTSCNRATSNRVCIGELMVSGACVDNYYEQSVIFSVMSLPATATVVSGSLPPGIIISYDTGQFTLFGIPTSAGEYLFTVRVEASNGSFQEESFTIYVVEILPDTLPNGTVGNEYSQTLMTNGPTLGTVTWAVTSGFLPPGLTLNSATGQITGIPTSQGTANFTITMTDER